MLSYYYHVLIKVLLHREPSGEPSLNERRPREPSLDKRKMCNWSLFLQITFRNYPKTNMTTIFLWLFLVILITGFDFKEASVHSCFFKIDVLKMFCSIHWKFTGGSFNKVVAWRIATLLKEALTQVFSCEYYDKCLRKGFFIEHLWRLLLTLTSLKSLFVRFALRFSPKMIYLVNTQLVI